MSESNRGIMGEIRYGVAGSPIRHSLSPLLLSLVCDHLHLSGRSMTLKMELVNVASISDALAWGYAGSVPNPQEWDLTQAVFGTFRTTALMDKAVAAARAVKIPAAALAPKDEVFVGQVPPRHAQKLPTRMFENEIWMNLTSPLKHQLDSEAVICIDHSRDIKSINALRWDGKGWWSAGFDGLGICDVMAHHGFHPRDNVLGLLGGGGAARSTALAWAQNGGTIHLLGGKRELGEGPWVDSLTSQEPDVVVNFESGMPVFDADVVLHASYSNMEGALDERVDRILAMPLDGRWLLVAQHLACWKHLWAPERKADLPSLELLLNRLIVAETTLSEYA